MPESLRLFVAIELPGDVREALSRLQHELQRRGLEKLRWVRPEGIHLTLKFLGATPAEKVPSIEEAIRRWANNGPCPRELSLGVLGGFGGSRLPRVLWIGLEGDLQSLHALQTRVDTALSEIGFPREARSWSPHLTLARVRPETARDVAGALASAITGTKAATLVIPVREISLMLSTLRPSGAVYERLAAFPLGEA